MQRGMLKPRKKATPLVLLLRPEPDRLVVSRLHLGVTVVSLHGQHDVFAAMVLRDRLAELEHEWAPLVLDLTRACAVDDAVLAVIMAAERTAREAGRAFLVALDADRCAEVLGGICPFKLATRLPIASTRDDAVAALVPLALAA